MRPRSFLWLVIVAGALVPLQDAHAITIRINFFKPDGSAFTGTVSVKAVPAEDPATTPFDTKSMVSGDTITVPSTSFTPYPDKTLALVFESGTTVLRLTGLNGATMNPNTFTLNIVIPDSGVHGYMGAGAPTCESGTSCEPQSRCVPCRRGLLRLRHRCS